MKESVAACFQRLFSYCASEMLAGERSFSMNGNFRVGSLFGIPFFINVSWFVVLAIVTLSYGTTLGLFVGFIAALLLFASVLAHELGHSAAAIAQGIQVKSIALFLFGGIASLEKDSETPAGAFWLAIAGPLVSIFLWLALSGIAIAIGAGGKLGALLDLLASVNLAVAVFNMIPGLPLDGGNVLRAIVWKATGNPNKGMTIAGRVGQVVGWLAFAVSFLPVLLDGMLPNYWLALIGWFLVGNARAATAYGKLQEKFAGLTAMDALALDRPVVSQDLSLREFANEHVIGQERWQEFLVADADGKLVGFVRIDDMRHVRTSDWPATPLSQLVKPIDAENAVRADRPLLEVVKLLDERNASQFPVVDADGTARGFARKNSDSQPIAKAICLIANRNIYGDRLRKTISLPTTGLRAIAPPLPSTSASRRKSSFLDSASMVLASFFLALGGEVEPAVFQTEGEDTAIEVRAHGSHQTFANAICDRRYLLLDRRNKVLLGRQGGFF